MTFTEFLVFSYLYIRDGKNSNFISQHSLCPVLIHSADHSEYVILKHTRKKTESRNEEEEAAN